MIIVLRYNIPTVIYLFKEKMIQSRSAGRFEKRWMAMELVIYVARQFGIEVSNIILSCSERRVQPLFALSCTQCKTFGAPQSENTFKSFFLPSSPTGSY